MDITETYTAVWTDEAYPQTPFRVNIARLDKSENKAYWDSLTEAERDLEDGYVFYYVNHKQELDDLFTDDGYDFKLIKEG